MVIIASFGFSGVSDCSSAHQIDNASSTLSDVVMNGSVSVSWSSISGGRLSDQRGMSVSSHESDCSIRCSTASRDGVSIVISSREIHDSSFSSADQDVSRSLV